MAKIKLPRNFAYSTSEYVIEYLSSSGKGTIIIDTNVYTANHKEIQRRLKGCEILKWYQRAKGEAV